MIGKDIGKDGISEYVGFAVGVNTLGGM